MDNLKQFNENGLPEYIIEKCDEYERLGLSEFQYWESEQIGKYVDPDEYDELEYKPNPITGENVPSILHHSRMLMALYAEVIQHIPRLSQEYTTDFERGGNAYSKGYTMGGSGVDNDMPIGVLALDLSRTTVERMITQRFGTIQRMLEVANLPQLTIDQALSNTEYISGLVLIHEFGHAIHRYIRTSRLYSEEYTRRSENPETDQDEPVYFDINDGNNDINRERIEQLQISPLPGDIVQTQRWIAEASRDDKIKKYNELNGLGEHYGPTPTDDQIAEFCNRLYRQTEYIYTHLTSEVFANLFVGYCAKNLPTLQELARNAGRSDNGIRSIAY